MKSFLKWPGGKGMELPVIHKYMPAYTGRYIDPFVGGGAVYLDAPARSLCINDLSRDLIGLYRCIRESDPDFLEFLMRSAEEFHTLSELVDEKKDTILRLCSETDAAEKLVRAFQSELDGPAQLRRDVFLQEVRKNLARKLRRLRAITPTASPQASSTESIQASSTAAIPLPLPQDHEIHISAGDMLQTVEAALKSAYYMYQRDLFNHPEGLSPGQRAAVFYFIREYCYSSMFRYNSKGEFNVPYGGISYNRKDFGAKIRELLSDELRDRLLRTEIHCEDFEVFLHSVSPGPDDFVFLDPPYDSDFSTYAQNRFSREEQLRLRALLTDIPSRFMLVIGNTDFIRGLYEDAFRIRRFDKTYKVSFKDRNNRNTEHLLITNY